MSATFLYAHGKAVGCEAVSLLSLYAFMLWTGTTSVPSSGSSQTTFKTG